MSPTIEERFWSKVDRRGPDDCWLWRAYFNKVNGYGWFTVRSGTQDTAHRLAFGFTRGAIPPGMCVCHTCDNRLCCNPNHLFIGTHGDNQRDKQKKGRAARKLTPDVVRAIRREQAPQRQIAKKYGISQSEVGFILRREHWSHV